MAVHKLSWCRLGAFVCVAENPPVASLSVGGSVELKPKSPLPPAIQTSMGDLRIFMVAG